MVCTSLLTFVYIMAVTFGEVPKENQRFVDIVLGVLLGTWLTGGMNYITGGSLTGPKKPSAPGTATVDIQATATTETKVEEQTDTDHKE